MDEQAPKRLRPFPVMPLLAIFAAALFMCLGYSTHWIWQRHQFLSHPEFGGATQGLLSGPEPRPSPWPIRILGEPGMAIIGIPDESFREEAQSLFPEASWIEVPITEIW